MFDKLTREQVRSIAEIQVGLLQKRLQEQNVQLTVAEDALDKLVDLGYDDTLGARPLKRAVQRYLENPLADEILARENSDRLSLQARVEDGSIVFAPLH